MTEAEKGQGGARTRPDPGDFAENAGLEQVLLALEGQQAAPMLPGLHEEIDATTLDTIGAVAEKLNAVRRARGRPLNSGNKRNSEVFDYLEARGFKRPIMHLMEIISADPRELAKALAHPLASEPRFDNVLEVVKVQLAAARELMPYDLAKRQELKVDHSHKVLGIMVGGKLSEQQTGDLAQHGQMIDITTQSQSDQTPFAQE